MIEFDMNSRAQGAVFDHRGPTYMTRAADDGSYRVAQFVRFQIIGFLGGRMKNPTGHYVSTLAIVRQGPGYMVDGNGTVYGKWLEGVDRRQIANETRFKGYRAFRTVGQRVRTRAAAVALPAIMPWVRRLGGR